MTRFRYSALGPDGKKISGTLEAPDVSQAKRQILASGDRLIDLKDASKRSWVKLERRTNIKPRHASEFALELSGLLVAGAPLRKALDIQTAGQGKSAQLASAVVRSIDTGGSLSAGLRTVGGSAATLAEFAEAGEAGAGLDALLKSGGEFLQARAEATDKIRSALAYPLFISLLAIVAVSVITLYVAPALAPTLEGSGQGGIVIMLAGLGDWLRANAQIVLTAIAGLIVFIFLALKNASVQNRLNQIVWALPGIGRVARDLDTGQSCSVLSALLETGRPLENALKYAAHVSGPRLSIVYLSIAQRLRDGETASSAFNAEKLLPLEVRRLALLGERSSAFPKAMHQAGEICHARAMRHLDRISSIIGPVLVIGLGAAISLLMLGVLGSLSSIGDTGF